MVLVRHKKITKVYDKVIFNEICQIINPNFFNKTEEKIKKAISCGISKININTDLQSVWSKAVRKFLGENKNVSNQEIKLPPATNQDNINLSLNISISLNF